jgi:hypothetical protein
VRPTATPTAGTYPGRVSPIPSNLVFTLTGFNSVRPTAIVRAPSPSEISNMKSHIQPRPDRNAVRPVLPVRTGATNHDQPRPTTTVPRAEACPPRATHPVFPPMIDSRPERAWADFRVAFRFYQVLPGFTTRRIPRRPPPDSPTHPTSPNVPYSPIFQRTSTGWT